MGILNTPVDDTVYVAGSVAAPAANATIASLGILPGGVYRVTFTVENTGTQETTNLLNAKFIRGSNAIVTLPISSTVRTYTAERVTMDGLTSLRVIASVNAIASSNYVVTMFATRLGA